MIVDSEATLSIVSDKWLRKYIEEARPNEKGLEYINCEG